MWHYVIVNSKVYQGAYLWKDLANAVLMHSCPLNLELKCRSYGHLKNKKLFPPLFDSRKESFQDSYDAYDNLGFQPTWQVSICPSLKHLLNLMANKEALLDPIHLLMVKVVKRRIIQVMRSPLPSLRWTLTVQAVMRM